MGLKSTYFEKNPSLRRLPRAATAQFKKISKYIDFNLFEANIAMLLYNALFSDFSSIVVFFHFFLNSRNLSMRKLILPTSENKRVYM